MTFRFNIIQLCTKKNLEENKDDLTTQLHKQRK